MTAMSFPRFLLAALLLAACAASSSAAERHYHRRYGAATSLPAAYRAYAPEHRWRYWQPARVYSMPSAVQYYQDYQWQKFQQTRIEMRPRRDGPERP